MEPKKLDNRAVSEVIGFVLIFGILVVSFSMYQAVMVPNQNEGTEFIHQQEVENDLKEFHSELHQAADSVLQPVNSNRFLTINLGTNYQNRIIAVNPPPVQGEFKSTQTENITIIYDDNSQNQIETEFLEYNALYNELPRNPIKYENSHLYRGGTNNINIEKFNLYRTDDTLRIIGLQSDNYQNRGVQSSSLRLLPDDSVNVVNKSITEVRIPTILSEQEWNNTYENTEYEYVENENETNEIIFEPEIVEALSVGIDTRGENSVLAGEGIVPPSDDDPIDPIDPPEPPEDPNELNIDTFELTDRSNPTFARVDVDWAVSSEDIELSEVEIFIEDFDSEIISIDGFEASGTNQLEERDGYGEVEVVLRVTDEEGNTLEETQIITLEN